MKASILLLAASAGVVLAQPASLAERGYSTGVCPTYGNPFEPTAACCYYTHRPDTGYSAVVCLKATSTNTTADFTENCREINPTATPRCCPKAAVAKDASDMDHEDLLCQDPKVVN
ncbi:hypothetical protein N7513_000545 [Penicillium frequentans]|nr:hypothetical protein N7513_000545 [Penicillium glabrum]